MGVAEHKRRKNEACSRGIVERYAVGDYVDAQVDAEAKIVAVPEAGRRRARADAVDEPDRDRLLQGPAGADDAQRGRRLAASAGAQDERRRGRAAARARGGRGGRARRLPAGGRGADDPADRGADGRPRRRRDRRHRRHRGRARGLPLGQPGARRRARQRAGAGRRDRRRRAGGRALPRRLEGVRQLDPVHERVGGDRRGARGRRVRRASCARNGAHVLDEEEAQRVRDALYPDGRINVELAGKDAPRWPRRRTSGCRRDARARRAVPADRARGAARAREAVPAARARARARRRARDRRRPRAAADRRRRPLGGHPLAPTRARSWPTAPRCGVLRVSVNAPGSTGGVAGSTPTSRRR